MKKRTAYVILIIVCLSFSAFRKKCNNVDDETSLKKDCPQKVIETEEWNLSPLLNLLEI